MNDPKLLPLETWREVRPEEMLRRAAEFYADMNQRRTVREFSSRPVPRELIEHALNDQPVALGQLEAGRHGRPRTLIALAAARGHRC